MITAASLRRAISEEIFDHRTLVSALDGYRKPRDKITALIDSGEIVPIKRGLYIFEEHLRRRPYSPEVLANLIYGPSYLSLDFALAYHGLIPESVHAFTSVTTGKKRRFDTPVGRFTYQHLSVPRYRYGFDAVDLPGGGSFLIARPEKALADKVWLDKRLRASSTRELEAYLTEDLRIGVDEIRHLDAALLTRIAAVYACAKVDRLVAATRRIRGERS
jgi:hypothetical protein